MTDLNPLTIIAGWLIPFLLPLAFAIFALSPLYVREGKEAARGVFGATWPRESDWGNNPLSQRVHEGGGARFWALLVAVPGMVLIGLFGIGQTGEALGVNLGLQFLWRAVSFFLTDRWIDVAEHGAEMIHGDAAQADRSIDIVSAAWMAKAGFATYSDAEAWRMTQPTQDYAHMTPEQFKALTASRRWASRIIIFLARW